MPSRNMNEGHLLPHSRQKPVKSSTLECPVCRKAYSRRDVLKRHISSQHDQKRGPRPQRRSKRKSCLRCALYRVRCTGPPTCTQCEEKKVVCQFDFASIVESDSSNPRDTQEPSSQSPSPPIHSRENMDEDAAVHTLYNLESLSSPETCFSDDHQQGSPPKLLPPQVEEARITPSLVDFDHYLHYDSQPAIGELSNSGDFFLPDILQELNEVCSSADAPRNKWPCQITMIFGRKQPERMDIVEYVSQSSHLGRQTPNIHSSGTLHGNEQQEELAANGRQHNLDIAFVRLLESSSCSTSEDCLALDRSFEFASSLSLVDEQHLREYWSSYSATFHKILPVIHMGSLEFDHSPSLLLATITAIGADYIAGDRSQRYASATYEKLFGFLAAPNDCTRAECRHCLLLLAARCLLCYRILDHRNLLFFNAALELMSRLTVQAAKLGLFAVRDVDLMPQEESSTEGNTPVQHSSNGNFRNTTELIATAVLKDEIPKWRKWVGNEQQKRLGWAVFATDHLSSLLTNSPSRILETDLKISSPYHDAFWNAGSAKQWRSLFPWTPSPPPPLPFAGIVRNIILGEFPLKKLSDFHLDLCIFVFEMAVLGLGGSHILGLNELQLKSLPVRTKLLEVLALLRSRKESSDARL